MSLKPRPLPTTEIKENSPNPPLPSGVAVSHFSTSLPLHLYKSHWKTLLPSHGFRIILFWLLGYGLENYVMPPVHLRQHIKFIKLMGQIEVNKNKMFIVKLIWGFREEGK